MALYRKMIRITKLKAINGPVKFGDNKEGLFALRVDRAFETPSLKRLKFLPMHPENKRLFLL